MTSQAASSESTTGDSAHSYGYDAVGRLVAARTPVGDFRYGYDTNGNRLSALPVPSPARRGRVSGGGTSHYSYSPSSNRLLTIEGAGKIAYRYDAAGNPTHIANRRHEYDGSGRLMRFYIDDRLVAEYQYNLTGERIAKTSLAGKNPANHTLYI